MTDNIKFYNEYRDLKDSLIHDRIVLELITVMIKKYIYNNKKNNKKKKM